jgi:hypothetical protein
MNKFYAVFLTAILTAGIAMARDSVAKRVAWEKLIDPDFLNTTETQEKYKQNVAKKANNPEIFQILDIKNAYEAPVNHIEKININKNKPRDMWETTEKIAKKSIETFLKGINKLITLISVAAEKAVKKAGEEMPGALEKAKVVAMTVSKYAMEILSTLTNIITTSVKKMMDTGDDGSNDKAQKKDSGMDTENIRNDHPSKNTTSMNQENQDQSPYKKMLDTLSQEV